MTSAVALRAQAPVVPNPWTPPVGIPMPPFGITQVAGTPTHYVDNTHSGATDSSNPNGSPTKPRLTIPTTLSAGAVVEVRGGPYIISSQWSWTLNGTSSAPVFIKGINKPLIQGSESQINLAGTYFVVEGLLLDDVRVRSSSTRWAFRNNEVRNWRGSPTPIVGVSGSTDAVVVGNHIHHHGDTSGTTETDTIGVVASTASLRIWIVDNHIHNIGGDSVRVGTNPPAPEPRAQFLYIGRNEFHDNGENGLDVKQSRDVIISENLMYNFKVSVSSSGPPVTAHYDAERVWVINNRLHSAPRGIVSTGALGFYVIGNQVWNIHEPGFSSSSMSQGHAIMTRSTPNAVVINNTVWDVDHGIAHDNPYGVEFINNIVGNVASSGHHLGWANSSSGNLSTVRNMLLSGSVKIDYGTNDYTSLESFQSATGKGQGSRTGDPRFLPGSLLINSDSPAVNAGYATTNGGPHPVFALFESTYPGHGSIARDSRGANRPSAGAMWDIGASEYGGSTTSLPPAAPTNVRIVR